MRTGVSLKEKLLSLIFPARCALCGKMTAGGRRVCDSCLKNNPPQARFRLLEEPEFSLFCVSVYAYEGQARQAILQYKFRGRKERAAGFAQALTLALPPRWQTVDVVCWVPISHQRRRERSYDQSELVARKVAKAIGRPCRKLLEKVVNNQPQHELNAAQRWENVRNVYLADNKKVRGKTILLIDDIVTTGATMLECASCLLRAGAKEVFCGAIAESMFDM